MSSESVIASPVSSRDQALDKTARSVGILYLMTSTLAAFAEFHVRGSLINYGNLAATVTNISSHQPLFRLGLACELLTFACDLIIIVGLYVMLNPMGKTVALLGISFRLVETAVVAFMTLTSFGVLRLLSDASYLKAFDPEHLQAAVGLAIGAHDAGYNVAFLFYGLGSTAFALLWFRSPYVPKALALLGFVGSILAGASTFVYTLSPPLAAIVEPACFIPVGIFEIVLGFWLALRGLGGVAKLTCP